MKEENVVDLSSGITITPLKMDLSIEPSASATVCNNHDGAGDHSRDEPTHDTS